MPYKIVRTSGGCKVVEKSGGNHPGKAFSHKPIPCERAKAQMRAIEANSKGKS